MVCRKQVLRIDWVMWLNLLLIHACAFSRVSASPFINSNSGQELLRCTLPPLPRARFEFEHKTNIQESLTVESVGDAIMEKELADGNIYSRRNTPRRFLVCICDLCFQIEMTFKYIMQ